MYFWQVISCNLFLNKNVKIAGKNCKIRKTFWCTVKVQWLTTSICWLSKGQWKYRGKWDAGKTCTFGSRNICSVLLHLVLLGMSWKSPTYSFFKFLPSPLIWHHLWMPSKAYTYITVEEADPIWSPLVLVCMGLGPSVNGSFLIFVMLHIASNHSVGNKNKE